MKKKRSRKQRDSSHISRTNFRLFSEFNDAPKNIHKSPREDRRRFSPGLSYFPLKDNGVQADITLNVNKGKEVKNYPIRFQNPRKVVVCQKRRERRESLFARKSIGKGKRVNQKRLRNEFSNIKCDRRRI